MKFGFFDDVRKEYVITTPKTPLPWINYLGSQDFFGLISNTGGGYCFYKDAKLLRLTRYRYNNCPMDLGGRYYYGLGDVYDNSKKGYFGRSANQAIMVKLTYLYDLVKTK